jgi:hypothetical protein
MDWQFAIDKHRAALKRVLAALLGMAGLTGPHPEPVEGSATGSRQSDSAHADKPDCLLPTADCLTLPRHLHRAILRLLRPAEAAARRLVIVAARDLAASSSPLWGEVSSDSETERGSKSKAGERRDAAQQRGPGRKRNGGTTSPYPTRIALPLADPLRRTPDQRRPQASQTAVPRIWVPGWTEPYRPPPPPAPDDEIDARRLTMRLAALARALDDLPREARRFARWQSRNLARNQSNNSDALRARLRSISPLRGGRPPGQLSPRSPRPFHAVHQILDDIHGLAFDALKAPDTS